MTRSATRTIAIALIVVVALAIAIWVSIPRNRGSTDGSDRLRIVAVLPMTGPGASLGEYLKHGMELGKEDAEQRYAGKLKIEIEILDSKNQPREGVAALQSALATGRADAVVVAMSSVSHAAVPICEEQGIATIITTTAMEKLVQGTKQVVRMYPTSEDFVTPMAKAMIPKFDRIAVLYINDDFGDSNQRIFTAMIKAGGKNVVAVEAFEPTEKDFRALLAKVLGTSPQAVFVTGYGPAYISIIRQIRELNRKLPLYTEIGFANPTVLGALGNDADGVFFDGTDLEAADPQTPAAKTFRQRYRQRFGQDPYQVAGFARDSVVLLAQSAMRDGQLQKPNKAAMTSLSPFDGVMGVITLDKEGESRIRLELMQRVNGKNIRSIGAASKE